MPAVLDDTICAIATPPGEGGIGVVRVSGPGALDLAARVVSLRSRQSLHALPVRRLVLADVVVPSGESSPTDRGGATGVSQVIDEALVVVMRGPHSFTGEDVVEVQCHGGMVVLDHICRALLAAGCRLARPGEFTQRAFLNGRLDLAQAEAVLDTIRAKTARSLAVAQAQRRGVLSREIEELRSALVVALSHVEAALDFSDEDIAFVLPADLTKLLTDLSSQLGRLLRSSEEGRICREGALVAIVGRPNVGKSSLMNALLRQERAIVTPVPGTTRDLLEEVVQIGGIPVRLVDTAGIRATQDPVETEGIKRSRLAWGDADLALILLDGSELLTDDDRAVLASPEAFGALLVVNKRDLPQRLTLEEVRSACPACAGTVEISAKELAGLDHLRERVRDILTPHRLESAEGAMVTNLRHADALKRALEGIEQATQSVKQGRAGELVAMDLRIAADALGEITGVITTDEILQRIFAEFCIGK